MLEVEAHAGGALTELVGAQQRRQCVWHSVQRRSIRVCAFRRLDVLPSGALFGEAQGWAAAEYMRVTPRKLVANGARHGIEVKFACLMRHLRVKHHLE